MVQKAIMERSRKQLPRDPGFRKGDRFWGHFSMD